MLGNSYRNQQQIKRDRSILISSVGGSLTFCQDYRRAAIYYFLFSIRVPHVCRKTHTRFYSS